MMKKPSFQEETEEDVFVNVNNHCDTSKARVHNKKLSDKLMPSLDIRKCYTKKHWGEIPNRSELHIYFDEHNCRWRYAQLNKKLMKFEPDVSFASSRLTDDWMIEFSREEVIKKLIEKKKKKQKKKEEEKKLIAKSQGIKETPKEQFTIVECVYQTGPQKKYLFLLPEKVKVKQDDMVVVRDKKGFNVVKLVNIVSNPTEKQKNIANAIVVDRVNLSSLSEALKKEEQIKNLSEEAERMIENVDKEIIEEALFEKDSKFRQIMVKLKLLGKKLNYANTNWITSWIIYIQPF